MPRHPREQIGEFPKFHRSKGFSAAVAVFGGSSGCTWRQRGLHSLDRSRDGVQVNWTGRSWCYHSPVVGHITWPKNVSGGEKMGRAKESSSHELRQAESIPEILLRKGHNAESCRWIGSHLRNCVYDWFISGERYVYKFVCDPDALFNMAYGNHHENSVRTQIASRPENLSTKTEPHHLAYTDMLNFYNCGIAHPYQHLHPYLQDSKHTRYPWIGLFEFSWKLWVTFSQNFSLQIRY